MVSGCLRHTELPNTSRIYSDFLYHFDRVTRFYRYNPADPEAYRQAAASIDYPADRRRALVEALREQNGDSPALAKLAEPGTVAVVTGQQVGLFSGPCYTIYKALTAARLAAQLNESGIPAVAVFWLATEDHDFAEVNHAYSLTAGSEVVRHEVNGPGTDHTPVGDIPIAEFPLAELEQALAGFPFADDVLAVVRDSYRPGATMGGAFQALLGRLLAELGLLFLDPMKPAIRAIAAPLVAEAVTATETLIDRVVIRNKELADAGYHAQVHVEPKTSLVFLLENGKRYTLRRSGDTYGYDGGKLTAAELAARADHLSPNALLRPVVQDYLLPTVAQIGGPAELAYLAQTEVIYEVLERPAPVVVPRSGFTLLDSRSVKLLDRYRMTLPEVLDSPEAVRTRVAHRLVPEGLGDSMNLSRQAIERVLNGLVDEVGAFDRTLGDAATKSRTKILYQLTKIDAKTAREALRRDERAQKEAAYLSHSIYPEKHLQERLFTILPFLAKHGMDLIGRLEEQVKLDCPDHLVVQV